MKKILLFLCCLTLTACQSKVENPAEGGNPSTTVEENLTGNPESGEETTDSQEIEEYDVDISEETTDSQEIEEKDVDILEETEDFTESHPTESKPMSPQEQEVDILSLVPEAEEGMEYLKKLGFEPFLFEWYHPVCEVPNGFLIFSGYFSEMNLWSGEIYGEDSSVILSFSDDLVYFTTEDGEKYQLTKDGFIPLSSS